jgi:arabinofuranosyltransferase
MLELNLSFLFHNNSMKISNPIVYRYFLLLTITAFSTVLLILGWRLFWFLTDDAYIAFRYISNSILGHGYVWNPPPFKPVEGYTSFIWVVILDMIWRVFDIQPPLSANYVSLFFSIFTLWLSVWMVMRMDLSLKQKYMAVLFVCLFLITNRTYLAWTSSGLETAMFNFFIISWFFCVYSIKENHFKKIFLMSLSAALLYLTRPDGLLFAMATLLLIYIYWKQNKSLSILHYLAGLTPFVLMGIHILWRYHTYGEWLPNTYYAKHVAPWPESGWRYALSFMLEYGLWIWLIVVIVFLYKQTNNNMVSFKNAVPLVIASSTLIVHIAYYTCIIGGDHFEYRVYSHLLPLIALSFIVALHRFQYTTLIKFSLAMLFLIASWLIPWSHWGLTRNLNTRQATHVMCVPIAPSWPCYARGYAQLFDQLQYWLIQHHVCMRHQEHKILHQTLMNDFPSRAQGLQLSSSGFPVYAAFIVGVAGWSLPHINIIDLYGLNDYISAHMPVSNQQFRKMAHDRLPPKEYVASFQSNVEIRDQIVTIHRRPHEFKGEDIIKIEKQWLKLLQNISE